MCTKKENGLIRPSYLHVLAQKVVSMQPQTLYELNIQMAFEALLDEKPELPNGHLNLPRKIH